MRLPARPVEVLRRAMNTHGWSRQYHLNECHGSVVVANAVAMQGGK